ncbi:MAG TPA: S8 family serine peptidase [Candidatus Thermoplasmatota archaeon]|jgi:subtilisin family serine protease|nr:S8 family serine peptidase [Candidatus Thermoplasmatota archaeon]
MKTWIVLTGLLMIAPAAALAADGHATLPAVAAPPASEATPGNHWIVGFHALPADRSQYAGENVVAVSEDLSYLLVEPRDAAQLRSHAQADPNVRYIERDDLAVHVDLVPNDTHYANYQYDMKPATTNMENAWDRSTGAASVKLCIVDTGQRRTHEDLNDLTYFYWKDEVSNKAAAYDDNGHGSHVTGTAAAEFNNNQGVAGIAPGASIGGIKVLNRQGSGTWTQVANGITDGKNAGCFIESLSLGGAGGAQVLQDAVNGFLNNGGLMTAAAGNDGPCTNCVGYPGAYNGVTTITCSAANNAWCSYSSQGPSVDLIAPGDTIASAWSNRQPCNNNNADSCYVLASGTSMSTPHVAGLAALYKSTHTAATATDVVNALKAGAKDLGFVADRQGAGLIQGNVV